MSLHQETELVIGELREMLCKVDDSAVISFEARLMAAPRVFVAGAGRSGLVMRAFAIRLMHLGICVHVLGDATTPSLSSEDLLVVGSGSGETASLRESARKSRQLGASLVLLTIAAESSIARLSDLVIILDAPSPKIEKALSSAGHASVQPPGSLFEQGMFLLLDVVIMHLAAARGVTAEQMFARHANLE
jgi:6-phospho-3-hexuloisomerase